MVLTWAWDGEQRDEPSEVLISVGHDLVGRTNLMLVHVGLADGEDVSPPSGG